jgi:membrane associated rhomboid family serine protease
MIPISDESRVGKIPLITISLIFFNFAIFLITLSNLDFFVENYGLIPEEILKGKALFTLFSSIFLHASFSHLFGNMWFLWIFGDNVENKIGKIKFLILYFLSGLGSSLLYLLTAVDKTTPVVGASGAISGVLGAYLVLFPKNRIRALVPVFYFYRIVLIPAVVYIGIWFLYQFLYMGIDPFVAYWGHIGGFLTGILLVRILSNKK